MPEYSVIVGNIVVNRIVADSLEMAEAVTGEKCYPGGELGDIWDSENCYLVTPVPPGATTEPIAIEVVATPAPAELAPPAI